MEPDNHDDDLPPTPFEIEEKRNARTREQNAIRERRRIHRDNRAAGHRDPKPGDRMYVSIDRSLTARGRAGLRFARGERTEVRVVDESDEVVLQRQRRGEYVVNLYGAELLLEDSGPNGGLTIHQTAGSDAEVINERSRADELSKQLELAKEELRRLRDARMSAPPSEHGEPTRLQAAARARAEAPAPSATSDAEFGGGTAPETTPSKPSKTK